MTDGLVLAVRSKLVRTVKGNVKVTYDMEDDNLKVYIRNNAGIYFCTAVGNISRKLSGGITYHQIYKVVYDLYREYIIKQFFWKD